VSESPPIVTSASWLFFTKHQSSRFNRPVEIAVSLTSMCPIRTLDEAGVVGFEWEKGIRWVG
jgi:hypothetical protein